MEEFIEEEYDIGQSDNKSGKGMGWYVVHTYSGYENKVKTNIEKAIENRPELRETILEVKVPMQEVTEVKNGVRKTSEKKMFPGYVLIHMDADDNAAWYVVRNTRGVTGFVGPGSKPVPLTEDEMKALSFEGPEKIRIDVSEGDTVDVIAGVWVGTVGVVKRVDANKQVVTINVELFGRETPVEISFADIKKI
jgi:transcriptional antiterminator NusG